MSVSELAGAVNTGWVLLGTALVFFMQAGFAMVESGFTRAKNAGNILMKILMDFSLGTPVFWFLGFGLMFGGTGALIGKPELFAGLGAGASYDFAKLIFQTVFCAAAATIVSGAMAERTKFASYCVCSICITAFVYPISGHWIWGGGWLSQLGFHDFAGSTAVHLVGGMAALIGAKMLGPRIGKYTKDGKSRAIPGHSLTLGALGVFILWFCWFGFNGCSTTMLSDGGAALAARVFVNTNLSACMATIVVLLITWAKYKKPDISMTMNGALAGLVAVTAGCDTVTQVGAAIIGIVAGFALVFSIEFIDKKMRVDDPVGAVGVHGVCGATGTLLTGLFAYYKGDRIAPQGLLYGGSLHFFGVQVLGVLAVMAWSLVMSLLIFGVIKRTMGLRVSREEEISGLDLIEHGTCAYAEFLPVTGVLGTKAGELAAAAYEEQPVAVEQAIPVTQVTTQDGVHEITKVVIIAKQSMFENLKNAMNHIGIAGMTVTNVIGCGLQKGVPEYYRGAEVDMTLLPKIQMDIVVSKIPVQVVVDTAKKVLYTGHIGDGKIFIYHVENVIKVRTGEEGYDALQDVE